MNSEPEPLSGKGKEIPADADRIVARALAKDPRRRYQSADELVADLKALSQDREALPVGWTKTAIVPRRFWGSWRVWQRLVAVNGLAVLERIYHRPERSQSKMERASERNQGLASRAGSPAIGSNQALYELCSKYFGVCRPATHITIEIDKQGGAKSTYKETWRAAHGNVVRFLPHRVTAAHAVPGGPQFKLEHIPKRSVGIDVRAEILQQSAKELAWRVAFDPQLTTCQDVECEYEIKFPPRAFAPDLVTLASWGTWRTDFEFSVTYPTKILDICLRLSSGMNPEAPHAEVWVAPDGQVIHSKEVERIEENKWFKCENEHGLVVLRLHVDYPIQGAHYVICWRPPE